MAKPNPLDGAHDIQRFLVDYAKQETIEPLRSLGAYLGWGLAGSVLVFLGSFFVGLGTLRLLQSLALFDGASWASLGPYLATIIVLLAMLMLIYGALRRARRSVFGKG